MSIELLAPVNIFTTTVLMVSHSISEAVSLADRVLVFDLALAVIQFTRIHLTVPKTGFKRYRRIYANYKIVA
jgi:ABC-type nitrate/sulfonate/bicarbonate transport system ATPase subunit